MKTTINAKAKIEVKELLDEYVVSPLNKDLSTELSKISKEIESFNEKNTKDIISFSSSIDGKLVQLKDNLKTNDNEDDFDNIIDTINDSNKEINDNINDNIKNLSKLINDFQFAIEQLLLDHTETENITNSKNIELIKKINSKFSKYEKKLSTIEELSKKTLSSCKTPANEIKSQEYKLKDSNLDDFFSKKQNNYMKSITTSPIDQSQLISKMQEIETLIAENNNQIMEIINAKSFNVSDNCNTEQVQKVEKYTEENTTTINSLKKTDRSLIDQNYKKLFTVSLSFGIVNTIGLVVMILVFLLK